MTPLTQSQQQEDMDRVNLALRPEGVRAFAEVDALRAKLASLDRPQPAPDLPRNPYGPAGMDEHNAWDEGFAAAESALSESRRELDALAETLATTRKERDELEFIVGAPFAAVGAAMRATGRASGDIEADLTAARGEIARLREKAEAFLSASHSVPRDHACTECIGVENVLPQWRDFRCAYHALRAALAAKGGA